jgi:hypothetical protein
MRELAKSIMSYTLAMSMFSVRQVASLFLPRDERAGTGTADAFNHVAAVTAGQLGQTMRATFQTGDKWQRQFVDMIFSPGSLVPASSGRWGRRITGSSTSPQPQVQPNVPATAGAPPLPPRTWDWGTPRKSSASPPISSSSGEQPLATPEKGTSPPQQDPSPIDGADTGWGPMP